MRKNIREPGRGFTLIELLVVIAIIVLLIGILLPSLHKAKVMGSALVCRNNLRQIASGVFLYAHDYADLMPVSTAQELGGATGLVDIDDVWLPPRMFGGGLPADERVLNPYLGDTHEAYQCPSDKGEPLWWFDTEAYQDSATAHELYGSSYFYASGYNRMIGVMMPMGIAKFVGLDFSYDRFQHRHLQNGLSVRTGYYRFPTKKVLLGDIPIHRAMPGAVATNPRAQWHAQDSNRLWANIVFLDGHVEFVDVFPYDSPQHQGTDTIPSPENPYY